MKSIWKANLAVRLLRAAGCDVAIEMRLIRDTGTQRSLVGKRLGTFKTVRAALAAFAKQSINPGQRLTVSVRAELGARDMPHLEAPRPEDDCTALPKLVLEDDDALPGDVDLDEDLPDSFSSGGELLASGPINVEHECDSDGPLVPIDGEYQQTCSECGAPQVTA